jgi:hypothetical protein
MKVGKRFLLAFGLVLAYMAAWVPILYAWVLLTEGDEIAVVIGAFVAVFVIGLGMIPYLNYVTKTVFRFRGKGIATSEAALRTAIQSINDLDVPIMVQERGRKLVITWRYVDAHWWEILAKAGLTKVYELHVKFNEGKEEAVLIDVLKSVAWRAGPTQVRVSGGFFRGVQSGFEAGMQWGITEGFELGKIYEFKFSPQEIKSPVMNTILQSGWDVRFGMW